MTVSIITIACLISPVANEILVPRMQIRAERSGWKAVKLKAEAPSSPILSHLLWSEGRTGRITDVKVAHARNCYHPNFPTDEYYMPKISNLLETNIEIYCEKQNTVYIKGLLYLNRSMEYKRLPPLPCLKSYPNETLNQF